MAIAVVDGLAVQATLPNARMVEQDCPERRVRAPIGTRHHDPALRSTVRHEPAWRKKWHGVARVWHDGGLTTKPWHGASL